MMRIRRLAVLVVCTLAVATAGYTMSAVAPAHAPDAPAGARSDAPSPYPHLANYNGLRYAWQIPFFADYGLVIARRGAPVRQLKRANPHVVALLYERTLQSDLCCVRTFYGLWPSQVPPQWWLVTAGSRLTRPIDARQQWIPVADPRPFERCQDVLVDGESMHVWSIRGHLLNVLRGYYSHAAPHRAGALISPHYSYRSDLSNCRLSGPASSMRPWSFNLSSLCPRWHGQTWADFLAQRIADLVRREGWDGVFYDNLSDFPPSPLVDVNDDGRPDGGVVDGVNTWRAGERALLAATRRLLPGAPLMVNGDLLIDGLAQGREMEGFPLIPGLAVSAAIDAYLYDNEHGAHLSIVNPDSVDRPYPSMPAVQLSVEASLLGDGYTTYDYGWLNHGATWWFDEYDDGAGSASLQPIVSQAMLVPVAHPERFRRGDVVLFDSEAARVLRVLRHSLLLQRGILGTVPTWHMQRVVMTTPQQRHAESGYLGQPLGPARLVPTGPWARYVLPVSLARGPALVDSRPQRAGVQSISVTTTLDITSTVHYDPGATRLTLLARPAEKALRTLVFTARGPAGQSLWVGDGAASAPLVLRSSWHRYAIPVGGAGRLELDLGRIGGHVQIKDLQLVGVQAFMWRRDFTHGAIVVNPTDIVQRLPLERPYRILSGDQDPWANSGRLVRTADVARYRAVILLRQT